MRFWYDTEFIEDGTTIDLVSIGVVAEDGREYYAVSSEFDASRAGDWVRQHVIGQLPPLGDPAWRTRVQIRADLEEFFGAQPVFWAWVSAYDHVVLCQLWGSMVELPQSYPRWTRDVKQLWHALERPQLPRQSGGEHHALADARHVKLRFDAMAERAYHLGLTV